MRKVQPHLKPTRPWKKPGERSLDFEAELKRRKLPISINVVRNLASQFGNYEKAAATASLRTAKLYEHGSVYVAEVVYDALMNYAHIIESEANGGKRNKTLDRTHTLRIRNISGKGPNYA